MRLIAILLALPVLFGCRQILGLEDPVGSTGGAGGSLNSGAGGTAGHGASASGGSGGTAGGGGAGACGTLNTLVEDFMSPVVEQWRLYVDPGNLVGLTGDASGAVTLSTDASTPGGDVGLTSWSAYRVAGSSLVVHFSALELNAMGDNLAVVLISPELSGPMRTLTVRVNSTGVTGSITPGGEFASDPVLDLTSGTIRINEANGLFHIEVLSGSSTVFSSLSPMGVFPRGYAKVILNLSSPGNSSVVLNGVNLEGGALPHCPISDLAQDFGTAEWDAFFEDPTCALERDRGELGGLEVTNAGGCALGMSSSYSFAGSSRTFQINSAAVPIGGAASLTIKSGNEEAARFFHDIAGVVGMTGTGGSFRTLPGLPGYLRIIDELGALQAQWSPDGTDWTGYNVPAGPASDALRLEWEVISPVNDTTTLTIEDHGP